jgi:hypothetical protein
MTISGFLRRQQEKTLVKHVERLEEAGFPPTTESVWQLACSFAEKNCIPHQFSRDTRLAGNDCMQLFLKHHPEITVRKAEGVCITHGLGICRQEVDNYFTLLLQIFQENSFLVNPGKIHSMDKHGLQMNNELCKVIATKGS